MMKRNGWLARFWLNYHGMRRDFGVFDSILATWSLMSKGLSVEPMIKRRSFPVRFVRSYIGWRKYLGIRASLAAAWRTSRS